MGSSSAEDSIHNIMDIMIDPRLSKLINWTGRPAPGYQTAGQKYKVQGSQMVAFISGKYKYA